MGKIIMMLHGQHTLNAKLNMDATGVGTHFQTDVKLKLTNL